MKVQLNKKLIGVICFTLLSFTTSFAATYYIDGDTGDDTNNGSSGSPWASLDYALSTEPSPNVQPGDTIYMHGGTYTQRANPSNANNLVLVEITGTPGNYITIEAIDPVNDPVIFDDPSVNILLYFRLVDGVVPRHMKFIGLRFDGICCGYPVWIGRNSDGAANQPTDIHFINCKFYDAHNSTLFGSNLVSNLTVDRCEFWGSGQPSVSDPAHHLYTGGTGHVIINNIFRDPTTSETCPSGNCFFLHILLDGHGESWDTLAATIVHNLFQGYNPAKPNAAMVSGGTGGYQYPGKIVYRNNVFLDVGPGDAAVNYKYNSWGDNWITFEDNFSTAAYQIRDTGADPPVEMSPFSASNTVNNTVNDYDFVDYTNRDFRINSPQSVLVDAGSTCPLCPTYDFLGNDRDANPDVGPYEYIVTGPPLKAINPSPANGVIDQSINVNLAWEDGGNAENFNVYFGTTSGSLSLMGSQSGTTYILDTLLFSTQYFWRIDSTNSFGTTSGDEWNFTTAPFLPPPAPIVTEGRGIELNGISVE